MHHHLAATGNLGQVLRRHFPIAIGNRLNESDTEEVSIVGPLCTPLDTLADKIVLPKADIGDYVVIFQSGAYGATASPQSFLSHPKVLEAFL
jgi:diaminopimelate decarboxylase